MKKNGFTIVELLATLTIILLIATLVVPNLMKMSEDVRTNQYEAQIELIESAAREYGENYINDLPQEYSNEGSTKNYVLVETLISEGYLKGESNNKTEIRDPRDKSVNLNNHKVCLKYELTSTVSQVSASDKKFYKVETKFLQEESDNCA